MGKINKVYYDNLIPEAPDRNANRLRVYQAPNGEVTIHYRNFKLVLHTREEIDEWRDGFKTALDVIREKDYFRNDL